MPTLREKLKALENRLRPEENAAAETAAPAPLTLGEIADGRPIVEVVKPKREKKPKGPMVKYACGHEEPLAVLQSHPCLGCQRKNQQARRQRKNENRAIQQRRDDSKRLPDGSKFAVRYDAASKTWRGTLDIGKTEFNEEESNVFKLLGKLDDQYREWKAKQEGGKSA